MGGLFRAMPQTGIVFLVGTLALAGVWPFAGFFSKEAILSGVWEGQHMIVPFLLLALTALLTAFYMFRVVFIAFFGHGHPQGHPHEAPAAMIGPLWLLAGLSVAIGVWFVVHGTGEHHGPGWLAPFSLALAGTGILLAWATYQRQVVSADRLAAMFGPIDFMARRRYGLDALYLGLYRGIMLAFSRLIGWIDRYLVDGLLNVLSAWTLRGGDLLRQIQSGRAQDYVYGVAFGVLFVLVWVQWWRR
jgi:NADH-quinone oxidoreductase subunit L